MDPDDETDRGRDDETDDRFAGHRSILDPYRDARAGEVGGDGDRARWLKRRDDPE